MSESGLGEDVERFIADHIYSVEQLEILLLLQRTRPRPWSAGEVATELRTNPASAAAKLEDLTTRDLLARQGGADATYVYAPSSQELDLLVVALQRVYSARHIAVIHLIFSKPTEKLDAMRAFADAFRLRKKESR